MLRIGFLTFAGLLYGVSPALAATWGESLFDSTSHDFGTTPRGPLLTHYYRITNNTQMPVHVAGVRVSCGCTQANILQSDIAPGQSTAVVAQMDSRRFTGAKTVTIFVTFDRPQWEETRLSISAFGRDDLALDTEGMSFGTVARGSAGTARTTVTLRQQYWAVQQATSESGYVIPKVRELNRGQGEVTYEVAANLKPGLPIGKWTTEIVLTTNSPVAPIIRLPATVEITPALTTSPGEVKMGAVAIGHAAESKLLVRGSKPFKIKEIQGADGIVTVSATMAESRPVHVVTVKVDPKEAGDLARKIKIVTDLPNENTVEVAVKATVNGK
jgi:hypothetical protein